MAHLSLLQQLSLFFFPWWLVQRHPPSNILVDTRIPLRLTSTTDECVIALFWSS
jgi:hypothetical protein